VIILMKVVLLENANLTSQLALSSRLISFARYLKSQGDEVTIICANKDSYIRDRIKIIGNNCRKRAIEVTAWNRVSSWNKIIRSI